MTEDLFDKLGLELKSSPVVVGENYPVYGMVTEMIEAPDGSIQCVVNFNMLLTLFGVSKEKSEIIKTKAFEPGIFITKITKIYTELDNNPYSFEGECSTVIFGKSPDTEII